MTRYFNLDKVSFRGYEFPDLRELELVNTTEQNLKDIRRLDSLSYEYYGVNDLAYLIADNNAVALIENNFDLNRIDKLNMPDV